MPGPMYHSPSEVIRKMLVDAGLGTEPSALGDWPVYSTSEPADPDNSITVYDTAGKDRGRTFDGERQEQSGFQIRVRASSHVGGYARARSLAMALDSLYRVAVTVTDGPAPATYLVHSLNRTGDVIVVGKEIPITHRHLFTINGVASIRQTAPAP